MVTGMHTLMNVSSNHYVLTSMPTLGRLGKAGAFVTQHTPQQ